MNEFIPSEQKGGQTIEQSTRGHTSRVDRADLLKINENKTDFLPNKLIPFQIKFGQEKRRSMIDIPQTNRPNLNDNLTTTKTEIKKLKLTSRLG